MLGHLDLEAGLQHMPHQIRQQPTLTGQRDPVLTSTRHKLLSPLAHRPRRPGRDELAADNLADPLTTILLRHQRATSSRRHPADSDQATPIHKVSDSPG